MQEWFGDPAALQLELNVSNGYEQIVLAALQQLTEASPSHPEQKPWLSSTAPKQLY